jgi:hypothetical protein
MTYSLTTKDLGEAIAAAVLEVADTTPADRPAAYRFRLAADAVFAELERHGCWFCRLTETPTGTRIDPMKFPP